MPVVILWNAPVWLYVNKVSYASLLRSTYILFLEQGWRLHTYYACVGVISTRQPIILYILF